MFPALHGILSQSVGSPILLANLVSFWELEEASGNRSDAHGSNDLTANNTPGNAGGVVGNAVSLASASSQYLEIANNATVQTGNVDFILVFWVYLASKTGNPVIASRYGASTTVQEYLLRFSTTPDRFEFFLRGADATQKSVQATNFGSPSINTWYMVAAWYDATADTVNISVNAGTANQTASANPPAAVDTPLCVGRRASGDYFNGRIDQGLFAKEIYSGDILTWLYNGGNGRSYAEVAAYTG